MGPPPQHQLRSSPLTQFRRWMYIPPTPNNALSRLVVSKFRSKSFNYTTLTLRSIGPEKPTALRDQ